MAPTQKGTALKIGYAGNTITGYIMEDFEKSADGDQDIVKDEDNLTTTVIVSDLKTNIKFNAIINEAAGSLTPPPAGSSLTVNGTVYRVLTSSVSQGRLASKLTVSAIKEGSMTYS